MMFHNHTRWFRSGTRLAWFSEGAASIWATSFQLDSPHSCALRMLVDDTAFDESWELDGTSRTGGVAAFAASSAGGSKIGLKVFEQSAVSEPLPFEETNWGLEAWRGSLLDVESASDAAPDENAPLSVYFGRPISLGNRDFSPVSNSDYSETTLMELTEDGVTPGFTVRFTVQGEVRRVVQLR